MTTKVLPGGIASGVRKIKRADYKPQIHLATDSWGENVKASLVVIEDGDTRSLPISKKVAEVLIANGMSCSST